MSLFDRLSQKTENYIRSYIIGKLQERRSQYRLLYRNDMEGLRRVLRPGDVILVEGEHWVSDWIKVFSYHTWTHCLLWLGESPTLPMNVNMDFVEKGGNSVEALMKHGVIVTDLDKYRDCNLRICRPIGISRERLRRAVRFVLEHIGCDYDELNVSQYVHFTFANDNDPTKPLGELDSDKFTCSSLLAAAFASVDFPIIHFYDRTQNTYVAYHPTQVLPKDFDLSLNFQVIKTPALLPQMQKANPFRRLMGLAGNAR